MRHIHGAEVAEAMAKVGNRENFNVWFLSRGAVEQHAAALQVLPLTPLSNLYHCLHSRKWAWPAFPPICYFSSDFCEQLSKFPRSWQLWCRMATKTQIVKGSDPVGVQGTAQKERRTVNPVLVQNTTCKLPNGKYSLWAQWAQIWHFSWNSSITHVNLYFTSTVIWETKVGNIWTDPEVPNDQILHSSQVLFT